MSAAQARLPQRLATVPPELLGVCALMAVAGVLLLWPAVQLLPGAFGLMGDGRLGTALGLLILELAVILLALGAAILILAERLTKADRVARGLSYIVLGALSLSILAGNDHSAGMLVVMLVCLACLAALAGLPAVRAFFTGPAAPHAGEGVSVTIVRTLLAWFGAGVILLGIAFLPVGVLGARWVLAGLVAIAIGAGVFVLSAHISRGEPVARLIVSGLMALYAIVDLISSGRDTGSILPLVIAIAITGLLWIPPDAQRHFDRSHPVHARPAMFSGTPAPETNWPAPGHSYYSPAGTGSAPRHEQARSRHVARFCAQCGSRSAPADQFCGNCGTPVRR